MLESLFKILPPPLLAGMFIYSAITFLWLQPLVEGRMAERIYIPQCGAGKLPAAERREPRPPPGGLMPEGTVQPMPGLPPIELPLGVQIVAALKDLLGADGTYSVPAGVSTADPCACSVSVAFDSLFWRSHIHVMSLRTYTPLAIANFDQRVAQVLDSGICGRR